MLMDYFKNKNSIFEIPCENLTWKSYIYLELVCVKMLTQKTLTQKLLTQKLLTQKLLVKGLKNIIHLFHKCLKEFAMRLKR